MRATFVSSRVSHAGADQRIYRLSQAIPYGYGDKRSTTRYIVVSAVGEDGLFQQAETYIFPASENGTILNFLELPGSFQGDTDHERALTNMGITEVD